MFAMNRMWLRDSARGLSARPMFRPDSVARLDRFLHYLPTADRQWPYAATEQIPQPFVLIAGVKKNHAFACGRVIKGGARVFRDQSIEGFTPGPIRRIKDFFTKFPEFINADDSDRFGDGFAPLVIDGFSVLKFFKWHRTPLLGGFP